MFHCSVNVNATNRGTGWTACHCASFQGHGKVLMYLMQYQPDLNIEDSMGRWGLLLFLVTFSLFIERQLILHQLKTQFGHFSQVKSNNIFHLKICYSFKVSKIF